AILPRLDRGDLTGAVRVAPLLGTMLEHPAILPGGLHDTAALPDGVSHRLFDVNVLAGLHGPDGQERMPVVGRGDGNCVQVWVVQRFANVLYAGRFVAALFPDLFPSGFEQAAVRVDQIGDLRVLEAEVLIDVCVTLSVDAGHADTNDVVGPEHAAGSLGAGNGDKRKRRAGRRHALEEATTRNFLHGSTPSNCNRTIEATP